jgi:predicted GIY-YIG superfamily endonuclease
MPYIYKITNTLNGKMYIGKTSSTIESRWKEHREDATCRSKEHRPLYSAIQKYGIDNFIIEQVEEVPNDEIACERETFWIEYYGSFKNGYNATKGGDGRQYADYDLIFTLFKEGKTGKEICQITGYSDKTITLALEQKGVSAEERKARGNTQSQVVLMLDKNTLEILKSFPSLSEAERFLDKPGGRRHISEVCRGKRQTAYGYKWKLSN